MLEKIDSQWIVQNIHILIWVGGFDQVEAY